MLQAELKVTSGKQAGNTIPLPEGKFLIGREEDCHLRPNSDLVSRHHCVFTVDEYAVRIRDLGSTNGTLVNGERIRGGAVLKPGDRVSIGKLDFEMVITDPSTENTASNLSIDSQTQSPVKMDPAAEEPQTGEETAPAETGQVIAGGEEAAEAGEQAPPEEPSTSATMTDIPVPPDIAAQVQMPPGGDTQFMQPGMQMPQMGYPMGYPQQMMPPGYPGYPQGMYPQQPMGYPQQPMVYPQQPMAYPQQPVPGQPAPVDPQQAAADGGAVEEVPVRLPEPDSTGAKPPEPPAPPSADGEQKTSDQKSKEEAPGSAGDIIQQYLKRRPNTGE